MHNRPRKTYVRWLPFTVVAIALIYVFTAFPFSDWLNRQLLQIQQLGAVGYFWFILLYIIATVAGFPASILTLGAGAVYGILTGTVLVMIGATFGAMAAFLIGRYLARSFVARHVESNPRFRAVDEAVGRAGFRIVLLTRLSPVFPFAFLNYLYSVTKVKPTDYILATVIGLVPGVMMYVYLGSIAASVATGTLPDSPARKIFTIVGLLLTVAVTVYVTRLARKALREVEGTSR